MKGVILAGGNGTRLKPATDVTNKHLLPVYDKPMIYYPIEKLIEAGIKEICIVTGGNHAGKFIHLLGNGEAFGLKSIQYTYQQGSGGIADALRLTRPFVGDDKMVVMLGDNIFEDSIKSYVRDFDKQPHGAKLLLKKTEQCRRFGVAVMNHRGITQIEEKPRWPKSDLAVTGCYMYDSQVWKFIERLKPSKRGELEITDVNNAYIKKRDVTFSILPGWWSDCGTFETMHMTSHKIATERAGDKDKI